MTLVMIGQIYLYAGAVVAAAFLCLGLSRLDENAKGAWVFRPLLIPGVLLIWPLVLWRLYHLWRGEQKLDRHTIPRIRQENAQIAFVLALPLILILALAVKQDADDLAAPVLLEAAK